MGQTHQKRKKRDGKPLCSLPGSWPQTPSVGSNGPVRLLKAKKTVASKCWPWRNPRRRACTRIAGSVT